MQHPKKLSTEFSGALRTFGFWMANGSVGNPLLEGIDYWEALRESPSLMEVAFAIFANVLEFDELGVPVNAKYAEFRAAQISQLEGRHRRLRRTTPTARWIPVLRG